MIINNTEIDLFKEEFSTAGEITTEQIFSFYRNLDKTVPRSTVNWRVYELVKNGVLKRVGKGKFEWGSKATFNPIIDSNLKELSNYIKTKFPFINFCIWDSTVINPFHHHLTMSKFALIDVEKEVMETVFDFLLRERKSVYLKPSPDTMNRYIMPDHDSIIVRQLISEAPVQTVDGVTTLTIEKMLVDIFSDDEFEYLQGSELVSIFKNVFSRFTVNKSKLTRYANRKGKQDKILKFIEQNQLNKSVTSDSSI